MTEQPADSKLAQHLALEQQLGLKGAEPAQGPYFADGGDPKLSHAAVLFLDLLGTKGSRSEGEATEHLRTTHRAIQQARAWSNTVDKKKSGAIYSFSDNIALGHAAHPPVDALTATAYAIADAAYLQLAFLLHGLFSRGAIAFDLFFADPTLEFIHGPALNRAVMLEKARAKYPRVALDEAAVAVIRAAQSDEDHETAHIDDQLLIDKDGVVFVNYLHCLFDELLEDAPEPEQFLSRHRGSVKTNLEQFDGVKEVEEKYRWTAAYHDYFVKTFRPDFLEGAGEQLLINASRPIGEFARFATPPVGECEDAASGYQAT